MKAEGSESHPVRVRRADERDMEALLAIEQQCFNVYYYDYYMLDRREFEFYLQDADTVFLVAVSEAHVAGYILPDRALLLVLNRGGKRLVPFQCDLAPWLNSREGRYTVTQYDSTGGLTTTHRLNGRLWKSEAISMEPLEIALFEIRPGHP